MSQRVKGYPDDAWILQFAGDSFSLEIEVFPEGVKLSSPQAFRIVKYLLEHSVTYQRQIHRDLGISIGWINTVVNSLHQTGIATKEKLRRIELEDPLCTP